jgi:DNA-binding protein H-NS
MKISQRCLSGAAMPDNVECPGGGLCVLFRLKSAEGRFMDSNTFKSMSTDELWNLHEEIISTLARRIAAEKAQLEERLRKIGSNVISLDRKRRPYPEVVPKYQNPQDPGETWSGRGKQPRWLVAQLRSGKKLDNFLIARSGPVKRVG